MQTVIKYFAILIISVTVLHVKAQTCDSNYFSIIYKATAFNSFTKAVITPKNETITIGNLTYPRGWMSKITAQGNVVWSNEYNPDYKRNNEETFNGLEFNDITPSSSSSYLVAGSVVRDWNDYINNAPFPPPVRCGALMNVDQSGNVLWAKRFISKYSLYSNGPYIYCTNVFKLQDGNFVVYLAYDKGAQVGHSYSKVICITPDGNIKWTTNLNTDIYEVSNVSKYMGRAITQTRNGNIIIADGVYKRDPALPESPTYTASALHFLSLNPSDGSLSWESSYEYSYNMLYEYTSFKNILELPNGNLSFLTMLTVSKNGQAPSTTPVNIITDNKGILVKTVSYTLQGNACMLVDAHSDKDAGTQTMLISTVREGSAILAQIDAEGQIIWSKGYGNASKHYPPTCFSITNTGYNIFMSTNRDTLQSQVLITDPAGNIDCASTDDQLTNEDVTWTYIANAVKTSIYAVDYDGFVEVPFAVSPGKFPLDKTIDCQKNIPCCVDVIDTINVRNISLCEGDNYLLPDNSKVVRAGRYDVTLKTPKGCDSTIFFNIQVFKKPSGLMPVADTCLGNNDSLVLNATAGFESYNWMGTITGSPSYQVYKEGLYYVTVNNYCGTKTDTIQVYKDCNYPIYMPAAFTPNSDGLNDVFRVPPQNKNRLVRLSIYNRLGQLIFTTSDKGRGWDGFFNSHPSDNGVYIYFLKMTGITGQEITQKGTVVLIR